MSLTIQEIFVDDFEKVLEIKDPSTHLHAFIAIHSTTLGPSLGGIRIYPYASRELALEDALRLAKAMTSKAALAGSKTGGGKSTIICDSSKKTPDLLKSFALAIHSLQGEYIGAEDVGCSPSDIDILSRWTPHVVGAPSKGSDDPCPYTAFGVYKGIEAALQFTYDSPQLEGKTVAIQGIGGVGFHLMDHLFWQGAHLIVSDPNAEKVALAQKRYGVKAVPLDKIYEQECDIFAPCAMGGSLNEKTIPLLKCSIVAGAANNQLATPLDGMRLKQKGILYAPDFIINSGGLLFVTSHIRSDTDTQKKTVAELHQIYHRLLNLFEFSFENDLPTSLAADEQVEQLLREEHYVAP